MIKDKTFCELPTLEEKYERAKYWAEYHESQTGDKTREAIWLGIMIGLNTAMQHQETKK